LPIIPFSFIFFLSKKSIIPAAQIPAPEKKNQAKKFALLLKTSGNFNKPGPFIPDSSAQARDFQRKRI